MVHVDAVCCLQYFTTAVEPLGETINAIVHFLWNKFELKTITCYPPSFKYTIEKTPTLSLSNRHYSPLSTIYITSCSLTTSVTYITSSSQIKETSSMTRCITEVEVYCYCGWKRWTENEFSIPFAWIWTSSFSYTLTRLCVAKQYVLIIHNGETKLCSVISLFSIKTKNIIMVSIAIVDDNLASVAVADQVDELSFRKSFSIKARVHPICWPHYCWQKILS